jgi:predicted CXXCH cytochrome family protein
MRDDQLAQRKAREGAKRRPRRAAAVAAGFALACTQAQQSEPPVYVGSARCAPCHTPEAERWRRSHHARALAPAAPGAVSGDFDDASFEHFGAASRLFTRDGRFMVRTEGADGAPADFEIAYALGVEPLQQYLVRFADGRLQALGIAWDTRPQAAGGQRWFHLYPDERLRAGDPLHWTGRAQTANTMCLECHVTGFRKGYDAATHRFETGWSEPGVACEACHGPGSAHVAWSRTRERGADRGFAVALGEPGEWRRAANEPTARRKPARTARTEIETCAPCHARRTSLFHEPPRGQPLLENHRLALLEPELYFADGQQQDEVYEYGSFLQSRMHAAGVTCGDCHEPHGLALRAEGNALCGQCHQPERFDAREHHHHEPATPGSACVDCHMPARTYMQVDPRRDHGFRVPRPDLATGLGVPSACADCHAERGDGWAAERIATWRGDAAAREHAFAAAIASARRGAEDAPERLLAVLASSAAPAIARATALALLAPFTDESRRPALEAAARDADPLVRHAVVATCGGLPPEARLALLAPLLRDPVRGVRIEAASALAPLRASLAADARAALDRALDEYRAAMLGNAERPESQLDLGALHEALGEREPARACYERAIHVAPDFVPAYVNLADLHRAAGREDESERALESGLAIDPDQPDLLHALGLLRVRQQRLPDALAPLARAAPARSRYAYVYAVALDAAGRGDEAIELLERAHRDRPGDPEPLRGLASLRAQRGDVAAALADARALLELRPADAEARALVAALQAASD